MLSILKYLIIFIFLILSFNIWAHQNKAHAAVTCGQTYADIELVIDSSGSMTNKLGETGTKLSRAKSAATRFINNNISVDTRNRVGIIEYSTTAGIKQQLTSNYSLAKSAISNITSGGNTCIECGIYKAEYDIKANGRSNVQKIVILLTDGIANVIQGSPTIVSATIAENAAIDQVKSRPPLTTFYTIGLGRDSDINKDFLRQIAAMTGGKFYQSTSTDQLNGIYDSIAKDVLPAGYITGLVYLDNDNSGTFNSGDNVLPNWTITLSDRSTVTTDINGKYTTDKICDGNYTLKLDLKSGYVSSSPSSGSYTVNVSGSPVSINFGVQYPKSPIGTHETLTCTEIKGWACDPDNYSKPLTIKFYEGEYSAVKIPLATISTANLNRADISTKCGNNPNHGFIYPANLANGIHHIHAYAIDIDASGNPTSNSPTLLANSPKSVTCGAVIPSPPPNPDPTNEGWIQGIGGDMRLDRYFEVPRFNNIIPVAGQYFSNTLAGKMMHGIVFLMHDFNFTFPENLNDPAKANKDKQLVANAPIKAAGDSKELNTSYTNIKNYLRKSGNLSNSNNLSIACNGVLSNCDLKSDIKQGIYLADEDVTINSGTTFLSGIDHKYYIFLIKGDLNIKSNIKVNPGTTVFFIVGGNTVTTGGNIYIYPNVSIIEGIYSADYNFKIESLGTGADSALTINGSIIINAKATGIGNLKGKRDLGATNLTKAGVQINYRPDFVLNSPLLIRTSNSRRIEVAPGATD